MSDKRKKKKEHRPEDLEDTQTESSWQPSPSPEPEGPAIEHTGQDAPPPDDPNADPSQDPSTKQPQEPLELGPFEEVAEAFHVHPYLVFRARGLLERCLGLREAEALATPD